MYTIPHAIGTFNMKETGLSKERRNGKKIYTPLSSVGRLDFLLIGSLADGRRLKVCVEFKNTHSPDYMRGLVQQLPAYLAAAGAEVGAYCGLDFEGPWCEGPKVRDRMAEITVSIRSLGNQRRQFPIQYFVYHLGKKVSAFHR